MHQLPEFNPKFLDDAADVARLVTGVEKIEQRCRRELFSPVDGVQESDEGCRDRIIASSRAVIVRVVRTPTIIWGRVGIMHLACFFLMWLGGRLGKGDRLLL